MCTYAGEKIELSPTKLMSLGLGSLRARAVRESRAFFIILLTSAPRNVK